MAFDILCLSHLAWERTLFQRPQQIMLRLAGRGHRVLYAGCVGFKAALRRGSSGTAVLLSTIRPAAPDRLEPEVAQLSYLHLPCEPTARSLVASRNWYAAIRLRAATRAFHNRPTLLWLYHPALLPLGRTLLPEVPIVYDVMDRFTAFAASPETVARQEAEALQAASVIFTGGRSIDRAIQEALARIGAHRTTDCFPSGIDLNHFSNALRTDLSPPADLAPLPRPVFGYFGAVDERMDFDLLASLAQNNPTGSVVLIGPPLGTIPSNLPSNLHLLGPRPYDQLPDYLRGIDVCLLPFRNTPLVAHISPTKTPEYLAGGRPVVSTPIPDVISDYGDIVSIAGTPEAFLAACSEAAAHPPDPSTLAAEARRRALTWDQIAEKMEERVEGLIGPERRLS